MLVFRYQGLVKAKVLLKVNPADAEDLVATVFMNALRSVFSGETPAEFRAWLLTITKRRIADYHRAGGLAGGAELFPPPGSDDEGDAHRTEPGTEGEIGRAEAQMVVSQVIGELSDTHQLVVRLYVLQGYSAKDCVEQINRQVGDARHDPMTEANVNQIGSRFRAALRAALAGEETKAHG